MKQIVIIGNSAAGVAVIEAIRDKDKESKIIVFSEEDSPSYCRCNISDYLAGKLEREKLVYRPNEFFIERNAELRLNTKIIKIDPKRSYVQVEDKTKFNYDYLILANGARQNIPEIKGKNKEGVFSFRTVKNAKDILDLAQMSDTACVLGAGLIGLKAAYGLKSRKLDVKIIAYSKQILSQFLDEEAAGIIQKRFQDNGIEVITGTEVDEIVGNGDVKAVKLSSGKVIGCQIVIIAKGTQPDITLVKDTDIKTDKGIIVDQYMRTNIENIYAAGDVVEYLNSDFGPEGINSLWLTAVQQGTVAGMNVTGENTVYEGSVNMNTIEFFDLPIVYMGAYRQENNQEALIRSRPDENVYKKLIIKDNRLVGAVLVGHTDQSGLFLRLIEEKVDISELRDTLLDDNFNYVNAVDEGGI